MRGLILQVSISPGGVPKRPVHEAVVTRAGILGDSWAHPLIHGGPLQALLLVCSESILELQAKGYPLFYGALGENLTTQGIDRRRMRAGQRYRVGEVFLELTKIRVPCNTLLIHGASFPGEIYDKAVQAGDSSSPRWALGGFYAAVLRPGTIRPNDIIELVDQAV